MSFISWIVLLFSFFLYYFFCLFILQSSPYIVSLYVCQIIPFFITFRFYSDVQLLVDGKRSSPIEHGHYGLIALLLIPLSVGATWYYCCCKRQIETPEINLEEQLPRQVPEQEMENAHTLFRTGIQSVTVAEEIMQVPSSAALPKDWCIPVTAIDGRVYL